MYVIQQEELFSFEQLMGMQSESKYSAILEHLPIGMILHAINKASHRGRPENINTRAMIYSLVIGKMEHMLFVKDIIHRLSTNAEFRQLCRFTGSDRIPSKASYSRLITKLHRCGVLSDVQDQLVIQSISEGFIRGETLAVDSSHLEAWDRNPKLTKPKKETPAIEDEPSLLPEKEVSVPMPSKPSKPKRSKRGRVPKAEAEAWRQQVEAYEASLSIFEQKVENMLPFSYEDLVAEMPQHPSTGAKGERGRIMYWYGYKANLLVDTRSQYIVSGEFCSGHVHDQRLAIVLLKRLQKKLPMLQVKHVLADKGYDCLAVYRQIRELGAFPLIQFIHLTENLPEGMDGNFSPICQAGHPYRYDSFDSKYETLKYTRPKECEGCPMEHTGCQKIHKIRIEQDIRRHTVPARGSESFKVLFKRRTAIERVFAYLKLYFGMGSTRLRNTRSRVDFDLSCLAYNLCKYALDRLNQQLNKVKQAS
ncbi:transposase [Paenibacillus sp. GCM10027628]|uniref:transposase n=1 Tax=Paenibacillus sp. GCM10027628 TaxID=3273413 RepID=UPI003625FD99